MKLRGYQQEAVDRVRSALKHHRRVLLQSPTGSGKTQIGAFMMRGCVNAGWRTWFACHRQELIEQTSKTLIRNGVDHSFIAAGYPADYKQPVLIGMIATMCRRIDLLPAPDIIFLDEAHHAVAGQWKIIIDRFPNAKIVGLSATPQRLDGRGLDDVFTSLVPGPPVRDLMDDGWLCDYRAWSHAVPDLRNVKMRGKDYDAQSLSERMSDSKLIGDAVEHYMEHAAGERGVAFCVDVAHSIRVRDVFLNAGVRAAQLDGSAHKDVRKRVIRSFREGEIDVLTSVDLFGEGFDLPELAVAMLLRPTKSLGLTLQQVGRSFRPVWADGFDLNTREGRLSAIAHSTKPCAKLIDHAGNLRPEDMGGHGLPDDPREWSLEGRKKGTRNGGGPSPRICPKCFGASPPRSEVCRYGCGHVFVMTAREIEEEAGELSEIEKERTRSAQASIPLGDNYHEAIKILVARGHGDPVIAAYHILAAKGVEIALIDVGNELRALARDRKYKPGWAEYRMRIFRKTLEAKKKKAEAA